MRVWLQNRSKGKLQTNQIENALHTRNRIDEVLSFGLGFVVFRTPLVTPISAVVCAIMNSCWYCLFVVGVVLFLCFWKQGACCWHENQTTVYRHSTKKCYRKFIIIYYIWTQRKTIKIQIFRNKSENTFTVFHISLIYFLPKPLPFKLP